MKSNKTSCPTLNTLFRDPRTYKIQPDYSIIESHILTCHWLLDPWLFRLKTKFKFDFKFSQMITSPAVLAERITHRATRWCSFHGAVEHLDGPLSGFAKEDFHWEWWIASSFKQTNQFF